MATSTPPSTAVARRSTDTTDPYAQDQPVPAPSGGQHYALTTPIAKILGSEAARAVIQPLIPHGVSWERVLMEVHRVVVDNPKILKCTEKSIIRSVSQAVETGLVIGKTIHLVPLKNGKTNELELHAWTDFKGDIELVLWSGAARHVDAQVVYAGDTFKWELGSNPFVRHIPELDPAKRGEIIAGYSVALLNGSGTIKKIVVMPIDEIEAIRKTSRQWGPDKLPTCPGWYVVKTCIHRNCKTLPRTRRLATVMAIMDARENADIVDAELDLANRIESGSSHNLLADAPSVLPARADDDDEEGRYDEVEEQGEEGERSEASEGNGSGVKSAAEATSARSGSTASTGARASSAQSSAARQKPAPESPAAARDEDEPVCPKCGGAMWDNRNSKRNPKAPNYKCRSRSCDGVIWPPKPGETRAAAAANDDTDELPF